MTRRAMMIMTAASIFLSAVIMPAGAMAFAGGAVTVAASSSVLAPLREIAVAFEKTNPVRVTVVSGSTGKLYSQVLQGAPFDVFFAADTEHTDLLESKGLARPGRRFTVRGSLVVWTNRYGLGLAGKDIAFLKDRAIRRIAVANPDVAPYGRAAFEALASAAVLDSVKDKFVYGESVAQAFSFAATGNADCAIVALSTVLFEGGEYFMVDGKTHSPLDQRAVALKSAPPEAMEFLEFLGSSDSTAIFRKYGYAIIPDEG
ncbi:MAG: molybdate ABC transporter substrate-binding protein [Deltaproteobacteria bacterium]|nr:molybdate ABC transporter substrate-binding protein [Deltaproteobacteria bacterium]